MSLTLRKRISVKPKLQDTSLAKEKTPANDVLPNQDPSPATTVSTSAPKNDEAVQAAIQILTSQKLAPIKSLNLQNKNVKMKELLFVNPPLTKDQKRHRKQNKTQQLRNSQNPPKEAPSAAVDNITSQSQPTTTASSSDGKHAGQLDEASFVPQVKVGPDGKLILDESSTIITRKNSIQEQEAIVEDEDDIVSKTDYNSYRQRNKTNKWTTEDTKRFYYGIAIFGTDFSMMESLLFTGKRSRTELHKKFKREERMNKVKIDIALSNRITVNSEELDNLQEIFQ